MKTTAILLFALLTVGVGCQTKLPEQSYTGTATIAGLGKVAFPPGQWILEFHRLQAPTNSVDNPDYFVFKRRSDRLERLTFLRYPPTTPPRQIQTMLDMVGEIMGDGLPVELYKYEYNSGTSIYPLIIDPPEPKPNQQAIRFSFILARPDPALNSLCHAILFLKDSSAFIIAHAGNTVTNPEAVEHVQWLSKLETRSRDPRPIP